MQVGLVFLQRHVQFYTSRLGIGYKNIVPVNTTSTGYASDESLSSISAIAFLKMKTPSVTLKFEGIYAK